MSPLIRAVLLPLACLVPLCAEEVNLLKNNALDVVAGAVASWGGTADGAVADTSDLPAGVSSAIKISIAGVAGSSHGQLTQRATVAKADAHYRITAWVRSSAARAGYVQAKLYGADRKELKRITLGYTSTVWSQVDQVVDASGAAAIEVLLRWIPDQKFDQATVWYAAPTLSETDAAITPAPAGKPKAALDHQATPVGALVKPNFTVALVGDSTVQQYPEKSDKRGWGEMIGRYLAPGVQVLNRAAGGRSTKTFRSEGLWQKVLAEKPDLILIQFGHNDSHEAGRPESTDAATEFPANVRQYVAEAAAAGIAVVLVTPPPRRVFHSNGTISSVFVPYAAQIRAVASETGVPCIDLYAGGCDLLRQQGEDNSEALFCSQKDRSHFSPAGAQAMARLVAEGLLALGDSTKTLLRTSEQWPPAIATAQ
jgi:lysophospholipase L1-like esterase